MTKLEGAVGRERGEEGAGAPLQTWQQVQLCRDSASAEPQRACGQIREAVEKLVDDFDRSCVEFWRTPRVFEEGKEKAKIAKAKNRSAILAALLGEAPPKAEQSHLPGPPTCLSDLEKIPFCPHGVRIYPGNECEECDQPHPVTSELPQVATVQPQAEGGAE